MSIDNNISSTYSKKRKIIDEICGGIQNPPICNYGIEVINGELKYKCPSRDGTNYHTVSILNYYNNTQYKCDCSGGFNMRLAEHCIHIKSVLIYLCRQYIGNACEFIDDKQDHIKLKQFVDSLTASTKKLSL